MGFPFDFGDAISKAAEAAEAARKAAEDAANAAAKAASDAAGAVGDVAAGAAKAATETAGNVAGALAEGASAVGEQIAESDAGKAVAGAADAVAHGAADVAGQIASSDAGRAIAGAVEAAGSAVAGAAGVVGAGVAGVVEVAGSAAAHTVGAAADAVTDVVNSASHQGEPKSQRTYRKACGGSTDAVSAELVKQDGQGVWRDSDLAIYELDHQIDLISCKADNLDYLVAACSGLLCGALDVLWTGNFDLSRGREWSADAVDDFVTKVAKLGGYRGDDVGGAVAFLERLAPIPSDGNTATFGAGKFHHLRDFGHHPTPAGLAFSLLAQFTGKAFGTDVNGTFVIVDIPAKSADYIGKTVPEKIIFGTVTWFLHLVSDMAGSSATAGLSGGTGIPGPLLSLAKELSVLPLFKKHSDGRHVPFGAGIEAVQRHAACGS